MKGTRMLPAAAAAAVLLAAAFWIFRAGTAVEVDIAQGQSAREIGRALQEAGVISSPALFKALAKAARLDGDLKPGVFRLRRPMSSLEALWRLAHDQPVYAKVVIPEGFSARQVAERLQAQGVTQAEEFLRYVRTHRLEGYLFPITYHFSRSLAAPETARRMRQEFERVAGPELRNLSASRLSREQAVILASIVEREAVLAREKPMIAAVYLNRLAGRKPLEADPTIQYALGHWKRGLTLKDLKIDSPYNTYVRFGLPPGPICSPGLDSIRAVLAPARTDALYFVADNTGGHAFSLTYEEHLQAKEKAARERRLLRRRQRLLP